MGTWGIFLAILLAVLPPWAEGRQKEQLIHRPGPLHRLWVDHYKENKANLDVLFSYLEKSDTAKSLLAKAHKKAKRLGRPLHKLIEQGKNSLTDTTLRRRFWKSRPEKIEYHLSARILLNRELSTAHAVLDLAHELVHFTQRKDFNPYSSPFTIQQFLTLTIEGKGGEVEASLAECQVAEELFPDLKSTQKQCGRIRQDDGSYSRLLAIQLFYQVGQHYPKISQVLGYWKINSQIFPFMSPETPAFISSTSHTPYPLEALKEYLTILEKSCHNERRRLTLLSASRAPASSSIFIKEQKKYFQRCSLPAIFQSKDVLFGQL